jgi:phosphate transport system substrate-binding protein
MGHRALPLAFVVLNVLSPQSILDSDVPDYHPTRSLKGSLAFGPHGGFEKLLELWVQRMQAYYPDVQGPLLERKPSLTVPQALSCGAARCGIMPRGWTSRELDDFKEYWGAAPVELVVGADAVTAIVHPENPLRGLRLEDLDAIFSSTRRRGSRAIGTWGDLGLGDAWKSRLIHPFGMKADATSPPIARDVFWDRVLERGTFRPDVRELDGPREVLQAVAEDPLAIGFVNFSTLSSRVAVVPLLSQKGRPGSDLTRENILNLTYPLAWQIRLSYCQSWTAPLEPSLREFLVLILSRDGQTIVDEEGYVPISGPMARKQMKLAK